MIDIFKHQKSIPHSTIRRLNVNRPLAGSKGSKRPYMVNLRVHSRPEHRRRPGRSLDVSVNKGGSPFAMSPMGCSGQLEMPKTETSQVICLEKHPLVSGLFGLPRRNKSLKLLSKHVLYGSWLVFFAI